MARAARRPRELPPAGSARTGPEGSLGDEAAPDRKLTLTLPAGVARQLRARMAAEETTIRALVLEALRGAGYAVPAHEIRDRRRADPSTGAGRQP